MSTRFSRYPIATLLLVNAVAIVTLDQVAGSFGHIDLTGSFRRSHPIYHHDLRPAVRATTGWGGRRYEINTNSLGFRDQSVRDVALASPGRRVLLMGDSFTEGLGVEWQESFAGRLARAADGATEVLNAGVVGYAPTVYHLKTRYLLEQTGLEFDELVVFIDMSDIPNEILYAEWMPRDPADVGPPPPGIGQRLLNRSLVVRSIDRWRGRHRSAVVWNFHGMPFAEDLDAAALRDPEYDDGGHWTLAYKYARPGMFRAYQQMSAIAELCADRGIRLVIVIYPWPKNILAGEVYHPQVRMWRRFAAMRDIELVDLFPTFIRNEEDPRRIVSRLFIEGDVHWNAAGHARVASVVAPRLGLSEPP